MNDPQLNLGDPDDPIPEFVTRICINAGEPHAIARTLAALVLRELDGAEFDTEIQYNRRRHYWENALEEKA